MITKNYYLSIDGAMTMKITGSNGNTVRHLQREVDLYFSCRNAWQRTRHQLDELALQNVELADVPAHEDRWNVMLSQYQKETEAMQAAAKNMKDKTDKKHMKRYFEDSREYWEKVIDGSKSKTVSRIDGTHEENLKRIHAEAKQILKIDYATQITQARRDSQRRKTEAQASIEFSLIDQTFPTCRDQLIRENPGEYLRQATLYQYKLLDKKDAMALLAFGNEWMKTLPKEATWEQVENTSLIMIEIAKNSENIDLSDCRTALQKWLEEHPLSESPDAVDLALTQADTLCGRRAHILGSLYLHDQVVDMTHGAFQQYQKCSSLHPEEPSWKMAQALYHISNRQWVEGEQALAGLPRDNLSVSNIHQRLNMMRQERICSGVMAFSIIFFARLTPDSFRKTFTFDVAHTGLQLFSDHPASGRWVLSLLRVSSPPIFFRPMSILSANTLKEVVDFIFRNISFLEPFQKEESCASSLFQALHTTVICGFNFAQSSFSSIMNVANVWISAVQSYDAYKGHRRSATHQAALSTVQLITSDVGAVMKITSYADLLPLVTTWKLVNPNHASFFNAQASNAGQMSLASSRNQWIVTAVAIGSLTAYRCYLDYPCLFAASVIRKAEFYISQGKYDEAKRTLTEGSSSYFAGAAVQKYATYAEWLKDYPKFLAVSEKYTTFLNHLDLAIDALKKSYHYKDILNNLLRKKVETFIRKQDPAMLSEVLENNPSDNIVVFSVYYLLSYAFSLAVQNPVTGSDFLEKMKSSFESNYHQTIHSLQKILEEENHSLKDWSQFNLLNLQYNPPSSEKTNQWNKSLQHLQSFFHQHVGEAGVYQELQFYKLMIAFSQANNTEQTHTLFKESNPEVHQRFFQELVECTRPLWQRAPIEAIRLIEKVQFNSFKYKELIQNYGFFLSLLYTASQDAILENMQALESCIAGLDRTDSVHKQLHVLFSSCKIVFHFEVQQYTQAKDLLAQETTDAAIADEVATLLFERIYVLTKEKALHKLSSMIGNLGPWRHSELFKAFQAHLLCHSSFEAHLECLTSVITHLTSIQQLSQAAFNMGLQRHLLEFELQLSKEQFEVAKQLLIAPVSEELYFQMCNIFSKFFIHQGEKFRQTTSLRQVRDTLLSMKDFFAISNADMIQSYVNFLVHLENMQGIPAHERARASLQIVFDQLASIDCPIPKSLREDMAMILQKIGLFAKQSGNLETALAAFESIEQLEVHVPQLEEIIIHLKSQLHV